MCQQNRRRSPNQLQELTAIGRAMADAALTFDQAVNVYGWADDRSTHADTAGCERAEAVQRAAVLFEVIAGVLAPHFPKRVSHLPVGTDGNILRDVAEQMDRLDHARGFHDGFIDDRDRLYTPEELYPHVLRERSARDAGVCPLCGGGRVFNIICEDDGDDQEGWLCSTCEGDVKMAKRVLKAKRVSPDKPKRAKKVKAMKATNTPAPAGSFCLPLLGVLDCRTPDERAADDAAGIVLPQPHIPATKAKPVTVPALHNRISGIA
jgi:hypothetical protein